MPEGLLSIIGLLALGFILLFLEIFVPGGVLGILGAVLLIYACYLAFGLSAGWGMAAVLLSVAVAVVAIRLVARSRLGQRLVLDDTGARDWKAAEDGLEDLLGREGVAVTPLRPAGLAEIDEQRIDVVSDNEFLPSGTAIRVCEVEGNRVLVEPLTEESSEAESAAPAAGEHDTLEEA